MAIITVRETHIHFFGIVVTAIYGLFIVFLYAAEPRSLEEMTTKARSTVENLATKGSVAIGTYEVDQAKFSEGLVAFRQDNFVAARDAFERADPEKQDARTQFYIAYSYYRQGWGRISNDDVLFGKALESVERVNMLDPGLRSDDPDLRLKTPAELKNELEEGLKLTAEDLNPLRVFRERK